MRCLECNEEVGERLDSEHLLACSGLTLQEYAIRHHLPLDLLVGQDQLGRTDDVATYRRPIESVDPFAQDVLTGLYMAQAMEQEGEFVVISLGIRRLEQLLWYLQSLKPIGFQFRQEYAYQNGCHRVIAKNRLKIPATYLRPLRVVRSSKASFLRQFAVLLAHIGEIHAGYLFIDFPQKDDAARIAQRLEKEHQIRLRRLAVSEYEDGQLMRCEAREDTVCLLDAVADFLREIPNACERFFERHDQATVVKELAFDSAHFITDHPDKCVNLHGGRYTIQVKVRDHIDPLTGFVVDYGYLKRIVTHQVVNRLDHHSLNYVAPELSWRASTELLSIFIWRRLIEYLPGLIELQIFETPQSYCCYTGPSLEELQRHGDNTLSQYFISEELGRSSLRSLLIKEIKEKLKVIR